MSRAGVAALVLASVLLGAAVEAHATTPTTEDGLPLLDERTAYLIGARQFKIGVLALEYGITKRVSIGSDPPAWAARAFLPVLVPNLHLKTQFYENERLALMVSVAGYGANLAKDNLPATWLLSFQLSLFGSVRVADRFWVHGEGTYIFARATGSGDIDTDRADVAGGAAARAAQLGTMLEWRLTRIFSLTATGRYQVYTGPLTFSASGMTDAFTTVDVAGQLSARVEHPWQALAGVAVLWKHFHLIAGGGYGYYFIPGMDIAVPKKSFIPDLSLSVIL
jgi:hypothetical protein